MQIRTLGMMLLPLALSAASSQAQAFTSTELQLQGCDSSRGATSYNATALGPWLTFPPLGAPKLIPCYSPTGYGGSETSVGITRDGSVYLFPVYTEQGNGLARSRDHGATWEKIIPALPAEQQHQRLQPFMFIDSKTDKIFTTTSYLTINNILGKGFRMHASSDGGQSWKFSQVAMEGRDWMKMVAGPATATGPKPVGYPNAMYIGVPTPISTPITLEIGSIELPDRQQFYRSLDGGVSWAAVGSASLKTKDVPGCAQTEFVLYGNGAVGPDGSVYYGLRRCNHLGIATSRDMGLTWQVKDIPGSNLLPISNILEVIPDPQYIVGEPFAMDAAGNLYAVWTGENGRLYMAVSKDKGVTFSAPRIVSAPNVNNVRFSAVTTKPGTNGTLAIAYYGSTDDGSTTDGYITESTNALAATPSFRQVMVNKPANPLFPNGFQSGYLVLFAGGDLNEYITVKYAPNGDIWASYLKDMCNGWVACDWSRANTSSRWQGVTGRMVHQ